MAYKQPHSVQVIVYRDGERGREYLLLKRGESYGGFWQPVTGSLEMGETHKQAAVREVMEETGISCSERDLIDLGLTNRFEIAPEWRKRFAPGVSHNEEVCFALEVIGREVRLDELEHVACGWVDFDTAFEMIYWDSNRQAFLRLEKLLSWEAGPRSGS
ncbi:MAG TPA: dihydroneopterin triphosphate diphosphatase [Blastocatellia bacterium]|nr:dihydroneopterin triphosphate diphosphatase [Blastocatellia bacterium]